ncbi:hypothetical protein Esti_001641 [Eimeria stiedai]
MPNRSVSSARRRDGFGPNSDEALSPLELYTQPAACCCSCCCSSSNGAQSLRLCLKGACFSAASSSRRQQSALCLGMRPHGGPRSPSIPTLPPCGANEALCFLRDTRACGLVHCKTRRLVLLQGRLRLEKPIPAWPQALLSSKTTATQSPRAEGLRGSAAARRLPASAPRGGQRLASSAKRTKRASLLFFSTLRLKERERNRELSLCSAAARAASCLALRFPPAATSRCLSPFGEPASMKRMYRVSVLGLVVLLLAASRPQGIVSSAAGVALPEVHKKQKQKQQQQAAVFTDSGYASAYFLSLSSQAWRVRRTKPHRALEVVPLVVVLLTFSFLVVRCYGFLSLQGDAAAGAALSRFLAEKGGAGEDPLDLCERGLGGGQEASSSDTASPQEGVDTAQGRSLRFRGHQLGSAVLQAFWGEDGAGDSVSEEETTEGGEGDLVSVLVESSPAASTAGTGCNEDSALLEAVSAEENDSNSEGGEGEGQESGLTEVLVEASEQQLEGRREDQQRAPPAAPPSQRVYRPELAPSHLLFRAGVQSLGLVAGVLVPLLNPAVPAPANCTSRAAPGSDPNDVLSLNGMVTLCAAASLLLMGIEQLVFALTSGCVRPLESLLGSLLTSRPLPPRAELSPPTMMRYGMVSAVLGVVSLVRALVYDRALAARVLDAFAAALNLLLGLEQIVFGLSNGRINLARDAINNRFFREFQRRADQEAAEYRQLLLQWQQEDAAAAAQSAAASAQGEAAEGESGSSGAPGADEGREDSPSGEEDDPANGGCPSPDKQARL